MKKLLLALCLLTGLTVNVTDIAFAKDAKVCDCEKCSNKDKHSCSDGTCDCDKCDCHKAH
jgi:hypothetical protein